MIYYAHSQNDQDKYHLLTDHLYQTAERAEKYVAKFADGKIGYYLGLWHDIGKFNSEFQDYLDGERKKGPDHSSAGAVLALRKKCDPLIFPLAGHHAGLADLANLQQRMKNKSMDDTVKKVMKLAEEKIMEIKESPDLIALLPENTKKKGGQASLEFFLRMIFSCLVDADYSDTESHFDYSKSLARQNINSLQLLHDIFMEKYEEKVKQAENSPINRLRKEIYHSCLLAAENSTGIFRLTVPTGGGKTLSSMGFALRHAVVNNLDRVIVAIPYTSIIEQTADEYRNILGKENILEHHSDIEINSSEEINSPNRLAADNWDIPLTVTTTVQLFESIFSNRPTKCRKIHNLTNSIIILDEVQTLPLHLLEAILSVLQELADYYHSTIVLCTATQPALDDSPYIKGLKNVLDIIPNPEKYFQQLKRVEYYLPEKQEKWSWERVAQEAEQYSQCLVIVNTKKDALNLLKKLDKKDTLHLSTLMCGAHRRKVLKEVKERLQQGTACKLVATQVVEAGVNLDFPLTMRALGPLDRIVQAAGRCNREGKLKDQQGNLVKGKMIVFEPAEGNLPLGAYRSATDQARNMILAGQGDFHNPSLYQNYFQMLYQVVDIDAKKIQALRKTKLNYAEVAKKFQMIDSPTVPVLVNYQEERQEIEQIKNRLKFSPLTRQLMRKMQPYLVNIYTTQVPRLLRENLLEEITEGLYGWKGIYSLVSGIVETIDYNADDLSC